MARAKLDETRAKAEVERLNGYIVGSQRVQRRLRFLIPVGVIATLATWWYDTGIAQAVVVATIATYAAGYYITASHIHDWRQRLAYLAEQLPHG